jgi:hypothetical protein
MRKEELKFIRKDGTEVKTTMYDRYFSQWTYDQVHHRNLETQRKIFRLINDEIEDESLLTKLNAESVSFFDGNK